MQKPPQFKIFLPHLVPPKRIIRSPTIQQHCLLRGHGPFPLGSTLVQTKESAVWTDEKKALVFSMHEKRRKACTLFTTALLCAIKIWGKIKIINYLSYGKHFEVLKWA